MAPTAPVLDPQDDPNQNPILKPSSASNQPDTPVQPDLESAKNVIDRAYQSPPDSGNLNQLDQTSPPVEGIMEQPDQNKTDQLKERLQAGVKKHNEAITQKVQDARQKAQRLTGEGLKTGEKSAVRAAQAGERAAAQTARAASTAAGQATKAAAKAATRSAAAAGRAITTFLAGTVEVWGPILLVIIVIIVIIAIIFALFGISRNTGLGPAQYPASAAEKYAATQLAAISGDPTAKAETIVAQATELKTKLTALKTTATTKYGSDKASAFSKRADEIIALTDQLIAVANTPPARKKIIDQINQKIKDLGKDFPELIFSGGNCADLKPYIDSGQISIVNNNANPDKTLIVQGRLKNSTGQIVPANPNLCNVLLYIVKAGHKIGHLTLANNHSKNVKGKGTTSQHFVGEAVDIGIVDGSGYGNSAWKEKSFALQQQLRDNHKQLNIYELWGPSDQSIDNGQPTSRRIGGHNNHIHIGVERIK